MTELLIKEVRDGEAQDAHENHVFFVDGETVTGEAFDAAYVAVKSKDNAPEVGATSAWDLTKSDKGFRLRRAQQQGGFRGGGAKDEYWERKEQRDVDAQPVIRRSHAQEMALRYLAIKAELGTVEKDFKPDDLRPVVDWFEKDASG